MISITRLNHIPAVLNSDLIELIEQTPDTVVTLTNGQKLVVLETPEQIVGRVRDFRASIWAGSQSISLAAPPFTPPDAKH